MQPRRYLISSTCFQADTTQTECSIAHDLVWAGYPMSDHDSAFETVTDPLDIGWHDWVTANLGTDPGRAARATRAAAEAVAQGLGFNAAADAARASWDAARLAHVATVRRADPATVPGSLVAATALAVGGALA